MKISRIHAPCEGVNTFFGILKTYTRARERGYLIVTMFYPKRYKAVYTLERVHPPNRLRLFRPDLSASPAKPDVAWRSLYRSPTILLGSTSRQNNSLSRRNKSRTCGNNSWTIRKGIALSQNLIPHHPFTSETSVSELYCFLPCKNNNLMECLTSLHHVPVANAPEPRERLL